MLKINKRLSIVLLLLCFVLLISKVNALEPSFKIVPILDKAEYNPEDNITIGIILDGLGDIDEGILYVYITPRLVSEGVFTISHYNLTCIDLNSDTLCCNPEGQAIINNYYTSITAVIPSDFFELSCGHVNVLVINSFDIRKGDEDYPIKINFKIDKNAPSGDNNMYLSFKYTYNDKVYLSESIQNIKVTSWYDRNKNWIAIVTIIIGIISIIPFFMKGLYKIIKIIKKLAKDK